MSMVTKETLINGLRVLYIVKRENNSVVVQLRGLAGSNSESPSEIGAAHLIEHYAFESQRNQLIKRLLTKGAKYVGVTSRDDVLYGMHVLKKDIRCALKFLAYTLYKPPTDLTSFEKLKIGAINELTRYYDVPEKMIGRLAYSTLFPTKRPNKFNTGSEYDIKNLEFRSLRNFYFKNYVNQNFVLVICGNYDLVNVRKIVLSLFCHKTLDSKPKSTKLQIMPTYNLNHFYKSNLHLDYIRIDFRSAKISTRYNNIDLVLAKIFSARFKSLIRKNGLGYKADVTHFATTNYGIFSFYCAIEATKLSELSKMFTYCTNKKLSCSEITTAINSVIANILFTLEKPSMLTDFYSELYLKTGKIPSIDEYVTSIKSIKTSQFTARASSLFAQNPKITVISSKTRGDILTSLDM